MPQTGVPYFQLMLLFLCRGEVAESRSGLTIAAEIAAIIGTIVAIIALIFTMASHGSSYGTQTAPVARVSAKSLASNS